MTDNQIADVLDRIITPTQADQVLSWDSTQDSWTSTSVSSPNISFNVDGEIITLSGKEVKRIKEILQDKFPEDYI